MVEEDESFIEQLKENYQVNRSKRKIKRDTVPDKKLFGTSLLKRFDLLMNINEESRNYNDISFYSLLNYNYFNKHISQNNEDQSKAFFRGMTQDTCQLVSINGLEITCKSFYKKFLTEFKIFYEIEIFNSKLEKVFIMVPKIYTDEGMEVLNSEEYEENIQISPSERISLPVSISISQVNLPLSNPPLFLFFLFSQSELDFMISSPSNKNIIHSKKILALPYNICKFLTYPVCTDFSIIETMRVTQEIMISNKNITLYNLKCIFPNLRKLPLLP
jgi:hypothetical protein